MRNFNFERKKIYTGREFERDFIGEVDIKSEKYVKDLAAAKKYPNKPDNNFVTFKDSLDLARKNQPDDPFNPQKPFAKDILIEVEDLFAKEAGFENIVGKIAFYTAVGTPLDVFHGADGFLEYKSDDSRKYIVTVDLSLDLIKQKSGHKADVIIGDMPDPKKEVKKYLEAIKNAGEKFFAVLKDKIEKDRQKLRNL